MSLKINISYTEEAEKDTILKLLEPILEGARVKQPKDAKVYKHVHIDRVKKLEKRAF